MKRLILCLLLAALLLAAPRAGQAQDDLPAGPVYIVQPGDTLFEIARRFGVPLDDLVQANQIADPSQLRIDDRLVIPGLEGIEGILTTQPMQFGETALSLSRRFGIPYNLLVRLNRLTSPARLYAGRQVILPVQADGVEQASRAMLAPGETLLETAVRAGLDPWLVTGLNEIQGPQHVLPAEPLMLPGAANPGPGGLPPQIGLAAINPLPLLQGQASAIRLMVDEGWTLSGRLILDDLRPDRILDHQLTFFPEPDGQQIAMQGIHVMARPGLYPLTIQGADEAGHRFQFQQMVPVLEEPHILETVTVNPALLDPELTASETEFVLGLMRDGTPRRLWDGPFLSPSPFTECVTSSFGNRRSYNGSAFVFYHGGVDFCGGVGIEIFAPAPGQVVFAGPLEVRGNFTLIDHGLGVYTAYLHQSEILVNAGETVQPGQVIGLVGGTGRVTGAHLHWEVWVGGVQVDPLEWLSQPGP